MTSVSILRFGELILSLCSYSSVEIACTVVFESRLGRDRWVVKGLTVDQMKIQGPSDRRLLPLPVVESQVADDEQRRNG
jgi:hypothetical protein